MAGASFEFLVEILYPFLASSLNVVSQVTSVLTSTRSVSMMFTDALLFHTDVLNTNVDKGTGEKSSFHLSDR